MDEGQTLTVLCRLSASIFARDRPLARSLAAFPIWRPCRRPETPGAVIKGNNRDNSKAD